MRREYAGSGVESIDRFIESEMIISRGFMVSAQKMFGDGCKAVIRNLSHEYGENIVKYVSSSNQMVTGHSRMQGIRVIRTIRVIRDLLMLILSRVPRMKRMTRIWSQLSMHFTIVFGADTKISCIRFDLTGD